MNHSQANGPQRIDKEIHFNSELSADKNSRTL